jgi:hypothetical protein
MIKADTAGVVEYVVEDSELGFFKSECIASIHF